MKRSNLGVGVVEGEGMQGWSAERSASVSGTHLVRRPTSMQGASRGWRAGLG